MVPRRRGHGVNALYVYYRGVAAWNPKEWVQGVAEWNPRVAVQGLAAWKSRVGC